MKPVEVAVAKSEDLYQKLFGDLEREVFQMRGKANMVGALHSSGVGGQIRVASLEKLKHLQREMIKFYTEALGHRLDQGSTKDSIAKKTGKFFERCKSTFFKPELHIPGNDQNIAAFDKEAGQLLDNLDKDLQVAVHEAKKAAPAFWKDKRHDVVMLVIGAAITLVVQWLFKELNLLGP